ncbi:MAG: tRNA (guanosine(46)-N7)-methyltransferase TrmB [Planctomycetes bacterium]|nr:tRNA (guanosine(46)-N7)-methyltransferase TrmB [Planctomycetota bacterium]
MKLAPRELDAVQLLLDTAAAGRVDLARHVGRAGPVELEIGCGKGEFLVAAAARWPGTLFVGVEIARKYFLKTAARIHRAGLENARVLWMDSALLLDRWIAPVSLRAVHVYFPDPWPKRRHHKRRVVSPRFAAAVARTLRPGGSLYLLTDDAPVFAAACEVLGQAGGLAPQTFDAGAPSRPRTGYEEKWRREGRTIFAARWLRRGHGV